MIQESPQENTEMTDTVSLLGRLKERMPEIWSQAAVVGRWIWLEFNIAPDPAVRSQLKELGFHWNSRRRCWQHPCGAPTLGAQGDPRSYYRVTPAAAFEMKETAAPTKPPFNAKEYKVVALRESPLPEHMECFDTPEKAAKYWRLHVATNPYFDPNRECFVILLLNTRRRVKGHQLLSIGTLDSILVHPRDVFRVALIVGGVAAIVLAHNHPSGDPSPSEADIKVTRDLIRAGQLMRIEVCDHVIIGAGEDHRSLRDMGFFYN